MSSLMCCHFMGEAIKHVMKALTLVTEPRPDATQTDLRGVADVEDCESTATPRPACVVVRRRHHPTAEAG